jgi:phosphatidylglycerol:prolipoprotein diacylglycerol transferase
VGAHWNYYTNHLRQAVRLRDGGLAWQGAMIGGTAGAAALCAVRGKQLLVTLDMLAGGAASVAVFTWLGCFMAGCAYGIPTFPGQSLLWTLSLDLPDLYGIREPRVAVQLVGAGWSALVLGATLAAQRRVRRAGMVFALWSTLHSLGSFWPGFLRGDEIARMAGWRLDQILDLALGMAGIGTMFLSGPVVQRGSGKSRRKPEREPR